MPLTRKGSPRTVLYPTVPTVADAICRMARRIGRFDLGILYKNGEQAVIQMYSTG